MKYFWPIPPKGHHRAFRIMSQEAGRRKQVADERLASINALYHAGTIDRQVAQKQVEELVEELRKAERPDEPQYLEGNLDIFDRYFREEYESRDIHPNSLKAAKASFRRALALLGNLELPTASEKEIQRRIYALQFKKRQHVVLALNSLFRYVRRNHTFDIGKRTGVERVRHLTLKEFLLVLPKIQNPLIKTLAATAFATGCRVGELFPLNHFNELNRMITIYSQIDRTREERAPKTPQRTAVVVRELEDYVKAWLATPVDERLTIRNSKLAKIFQEACREVFPNQPLKCCHFYDLRHSYAIHFLSMGVSLSLVAQALGNSEEVCRRHYTGFVLSDEGAVLMNRLQNKAS